MEEKRKRGKKKKGEEEKGNCQGFYLVLKQRNQNSQIPLPHRL